MSLITRKVKSGIIEIKNSTIKKIFSEQKQFEKDAYWLDKLNSKWTPKGLKIGNNYILSEYYGPDLLISYDRNTLWDDIPNITEQICEMYSFFKENDLYKFNGALSNLTSNKKQVVAFDFKYARHRTEPACSLGECLEWEIKSFDKWLIKIDPTLPEKLREIV